MRQAQPRVFVSYRRRDVSGYAGRITDALVAELGASHVFQDVATVAPGVDFHTQVDLSLAAADAMLVVIGPGWLGAATEDGVRRLFEPEDLVRMEVAHALEADLRVVPVLVGGAALPTASDLPEDLQDLTRRQAVTVRDESFHQDVARLVRSLRGELLASTPVGWRRRRGVVTAAAGLAVVLVAGGAWWAWREHDDKDGGTAQPRCPTRSSGADWREIAVTPSHTAELSLGKDESLVFGVNAAAWRPDQSGHWLVLLDTQMLNQAKGQHAHARYYYEDLRVARRAFALSCFDAASTDSGTGDVVDAHVGFLVTCRPSGEMDVTLQNPPVDTQVLSFTNATSPAECTSG